MRRRALGTHGTGRHRAGGNTAKGRPTRRHAPARVRASGATSMGGRGDRGFRAVGPPGRRLGRDAERRAASGRPVLPAVTRHAVPLFGAATPVGRSRASPSSPRLEGRWQGSRHGNASLPDPGPRHKLMQYHSSSGFRRGSSAPGRPAAAPRWRAASTPGLAPPARNCAAVPRNPPDASACATRRVEAVAINPRIAERATATSHHAAARKLGVGHRKAARASRRQPLFGAHRAQHDGERFASSYSRTECLNASMTATSLMPARRAGDAQKSAGTTTPATAPARCRRRPARSRRHRRRRRCRQCRCRCRCRRCCPPPS